MRSGSPQRHSNGAFVQDVAHAVWDGAAKAIKFALSHMVDLQKLVQISDPTAPPATCREAEAAEVEVSRRSGSVSSQKDLEDADKTVAQQWLEAQQAMCRTSSSVHSLLSVMATSCGCASCPSGVAHQELDAVFLMPCGNFMLFRRPDLASNIRNCPVECLVALTSCQVLQPQQSLTDSSQESPSTGSQLC